MASNELSSPYLQLGGESAVRSLANRFYDLIETEPEANALRLMHLRGHGLAHAREAQFLFLSGFLGGPHRYAEENRHADVRLMHEHLQIDDAARNAWLSCMARALELEAVEEGLRSRLMQSFTRVADMLLRLSRQKQGSQGLGDGGLA